jgi:hypothetical protein
MELRTKQLTVQQRAQLTKPDPEDLFPEDAREKKSPESIFDDLIGCKQVRLWSDPTCLGLTDAAGDVGFVRGGCFPPQRFVVEFEMSTWLIA